MARYYRDTNGSLHDEYQGRHKAIMILKRSSRWFLLAPPLPLILEELISQRPQLSSSPGLSHRSLIYLAIYLLPPVLRKNVEPAYKNTE